MWDRILLILLLLYLLLIIILQNPLFNDHRSNSNSNSNPITIVGNIGPVSYEDGTLKIQYIGYPFVPFR
ncbi:hypothetical protein [Alkalihalobacillus sp. TS-13]|uniref:hypothetical protein n=1 Tax=Alkalihalobacillus sp. TS-13 TaxID=2842455 RepID=UPI001C869070|nr:hypothetical protein [Alkalihalobacillus sp. TS-13]